MATAKPSSKKKITPTFRVYFNKRKQWIDVYVADSSRKFMRENKCWAYYQPAHPRKSRKGYFGSVHFSRVGAGLVAHELLHFLIDWTTAGNRVFTFTDRNEERVVEMFGEVSRIFWNKYYAWKEHTTI
jgi:hypothetical protein